MSKISVTTLSLFFLSLIFFLFPKTIHAADIKMKGIELNTVGLATMEVDIKTINPDKNYTFYSDTSKETDPKQKHDCFRAVNPGPCIGERYLEAASSGNTRIEIVAVRKYANGSLSDGSYKLIKMDTPGENGTTVWSLRGGGEIGFVTYGWADAQKPIQTPGMPTINLNPTEVDKNGKVIALINFPDPKATSYTLSIADILNSQNPVSSLKIDCDSSTNKCTSITSIKNLENANLSADGNDLGFTIIAGNLGGPAKLPIEGHSYDLLITYPGKPSGLSVSKTFLVTGTSTLKVELNPSTIDQIQRGLQTIKVKLVDGTSERYEVRFLGRGSMFTCTGAGCTYDLSIPPLTEGSYAVTVINQRDANIYGSATLKVTGTIISTPGQNAGVDCKKEPGKCTSAGGTQCDDKDPKNPGIATAIGCIHTSPVEFVKDTLKFVIGISGGLAFLMMLLGAFQMLTSAGNPETLQAGRDRFQSAIIGLLFVIFAVMLLRIIGVDILGLGQFFGVKN